MAFDGLYTKCCQERRRRRKKKKIARKKKTLLLPCVVDVAVSADAADEHTGGTDAAAVYDLMGNMDAGRLRGPPCPSVSENASKRVHGCFHRAVVSACGVDQPAAACAAAAPETRNDGSASEMESVAGTVVDDATPAPARAVCACGPDLDLGRIHERATTLASVTADSQKKGYKAPAHSLL